MLLARKDEVAAPAPEAAVVSMPDMPAPSCEPGEGEIACDGVRFADLPHGGAVWHAGSVVPAWRQELLALGARPDAAALEAMGQRGIWLHPQGDVPPLAVMCCGQGAVWPGMGRELYDHFPAARAAMDRIARAADWDVLALLDETDVEKIGLTRWQQPYLFLLEYAQWSHLASLGLRPSLICGHSLGELIALCLAGVYEPEVAWYILDTRSTHMAELEARATRETGMMAVPAEASVIEEARKTWPQLYVSNYNSPRQFIISGPRDVLLEARKSLRKRRIPAIMLNVSLAFHHPSMRVLRDMSLRRLNALAMQAPQIPMLSCITTRPYPDDQPGICEHIGDLDDDARITFYQQGDYIDMCVGPHICYTKALKAFKLTGVSGAYWKGDKDNKMLTRINGVAFATKEELDEHMHMLEEAKKRDHRKIGREMDLFMMRDEAPGFPFFLPNGMILKNTLLDYWREIHHKAGYVEISTPLIMNKQLWKTSGHWDHYKDNMYSTVIDDEEYCIKPMNCPGGVLVYASKPHSYRQLPIRAGEIGLVHRHELRGALHGLFRVRCFNQDDAHLFVRPDQLTDEIVGVVNLIDSVYQKFGFKYHVELSTRPEDSMGSDEDWARAEEGLRTALEKLGMDYEVNEGDGAFYGPKIDFHLEDSLGRTWQCGTVQLDFQMPLNFDLEYVDADGTKKRPIMLHRVCFGSIERFIGILIEHFAGKFPTWLAPVQVKALPVSEKSRDYAHEVCAKLEEAGIRVVCDDRDEKIGYKIREARSIDRVPYMLILGEKEVEAGNISVRDRSNETVQMSVDEFVAKVLEEIKTRA